MKKDLVSIIMAVYNEEQFIEQAITSVLNQTIDNFELIIVDDGSTDGTQAIIRSIMDKRIQYYNFGKIGKNKSFNKGVELSNGEYIVLFAGDDLLPKDSLFNRLEAIKQSHVLNRKMIGFGKLKMISRNKKFNGIIRPRGNTGARSGGTLIITRALAELIFPLPELLPNEDQWIILVSNFFAEKEVEINSIVLFYRIHSNNSFTQECSFEKKRNELYERGKVYNLFLERFRELLDANQEEIVANHIKAVQYRYDGKIMNILKLRELPHKSRIRFAIQSKKVLFEYVYKIRIFLRH